MTMTADDIHAFPTEHVAPPPRRRVIWPWVLLGVLGLLLAAALVGTAALITLLEGAQDGVQVTINGQPWDGPVLEPEDWPLAFIGIALALAAVLVVVPCALLLALGASVLGLAVGLLAVLAAAAVVLSPLWLLAGLLWLLLRRREPPAATMRG